MSNNGARALSYGAVALAASSWGTWAVIIRHAEAIHPMPAALDAAIVMAVITAGSGLTSLRNRKGVRKTWNAWACVAWFGLADLLNVLLFFAAYKLTVAVAVLTHYTTPIFVALASPLLLGEKITRRTASAIALSVTGLAVMLVPLASAGMPAGTWKSAALGVSSAIFYASNVLVNKFLVDSFTTSEAMFLHGLVATPLATLLVPREAWATVDVHAASFLAVAAIGPGALAGLAFIWGLRRMPAAHASTLTLLEPLVSVALGAAILGERVSLHTAFGGVLIVAGAAAVMTRG